MTRQCGVALVLVLWLTVLLSLIAGAFTTLARTENLQSRHLFDSTRARYAAEAGLHYAVYQLNNPDIEQRWIADGRSYDIRFGQATLEIRVRDESGKIDLNRADEEMLDGLFESVGLELSERELLVDAILDFRDADDLVRLHGAEDPEYEAAGYPHGAKDAPFDTVDELMQVLGMNYELFTSIEAAITVHSGQPQPDPAYAPMEVLRAFPDMDEDMAIGFVEQREQIQEMGVPLEMPNGVASRTGPGRFKFTVQVKATMENGASKEIEATVLRGGAVNGRPFRIVRWQV